MPDNVVSEIRAKMLDVVRLMNLASKDGIRVEFGVAPNAAGEQVLVFKALKEMKLD